MSRIRITASVIAAIAIVSAAVAFSQSPPAAKPAAAKPAATSAEAAAKKIAHGKRLADMEAIRFMFADMAMKLEASRLLTYRALAACDAEDPRMTYHSSIAKCVASDSAMAITTDAVQIFGGYGYMKEYPVERFMRDAKITQIYEGTNQIQRLVVSRELVKLLDQ